MYVASPLAVTVAVPLAGGVLMLKVCVWPASGSFGLTVLVPGVFCGVLMPRAIGIGGRFGGGGGTWTVTGMVTVPERGGVPLSVTVTAKLFVPLKPDAGVYVASPLAVTVAVPLAGGVLMLKVCVWPASGSFGLTVLVPGVFCGVLMPGAVGVGGRFGGGGGTWTVTGMVTVPERGGVPLSVTVTDKAVRTTEAGRGRVRGQPARRHSRGAIGRGDTDAKRLRLASIRVIRAHQCWCRGYSAGC